MEMKRSTLTLVAVVGGLGLACNARDSATPDQDAGIGDAQGDESTSPDETSGDDGLTSDTSSGDADADEMGAGDGPDVEAGDGGPPAESRWIDLTPTTLDDTWPQGGSIGALITDVDLGRIFLLRSDGGLAPKLDLWEWDDVAALWSPRETARGPADAAAATYDAKRRLIVVFGGQSGVSVSGGTFLWDGIGDTWTAVPAADDGPAARAGAAIAYDPSRDRIVMFGGYSTTTMKTFSDTWEWDGDLRSWTKLGEDVDSPPRRAGHRMMFDPGIGRVVMFGGRLTTSGAFDSDFWSWNADASTWEPILPSDGDPWPSGRAGYGWAFDEDRRVIVLFGGVEAGSKQLQDTWEWNVDGRFWVDRTPTVIGASWPTARDSHRLAYRPSARKIVLYGGFASGDKSRELWEWDPAD